MNHHLPDFELGTKTGCLWVIPLICLLVYLAGACTLPIQQSPDEVIRLAVPFYIAQNGCLPNGFAESIRSNLWGISYASSHMG